MPWVHAARSSGTRCVVGGVADGGVGEGVRTWTAEG